MLGNMGVFLRHASGYIVKLCEEHPEVLVGLDKIVGRSKSGMDDTTIINGTVAKTILNLRKAKLLSKDVWEDVNNPINEDDEYNVFFEEIYEKVYFITPSEIGG